MKKYSLLCFSFFVLQAVLAQLPVYKRIYLAKGGDNGVLITCGNFSYTPGDTFVLRASGNPYSYVYLGSISGTQEKPVVIINEGGQVVLTAGIQLEHCTNFKITGSGSKDRHGFLITGSTGVAMEFKGKSSDIEAERFSVQKGTYGCWIKNEVSCDTSVNNWVLNNITVHDFEMKDLTIQGFYMGSTNTNYIRGSITCNNRITDYRPSRLGNIKIYNGYIDGTGRPAIQLSHASVGMSEIYNNVVRNAGREYNDAQGSGIVIGGYTRANIHHNNVSNTFTWGIASIGGSGLIRIEHNKVDNSGYLDGKKLLWPQNIFIDTRLTIPVDSTQFIIRNNVLGKAGNSDHIYIGKTKNTYRTGNIICNNTSSGKPANIDIEAGISWVDCSVIKRQAENYNKLILMSLTVFLSFLCVYFFLINRSRSLTLQTYRS